VRHGENQANLTREFSYRLVDYPLNERGQAQARETAAYLRDRPIAAVYASPLKRAYETAEAIAAEHDLPVEVLEAFREINVGTLEGQPPSQEIWDVHDRIFDAWFAGDASARFPEGEDQNDLLARMREGLRYVVGQHPGQQIVIAAHGGILNATIERLCPDCRRDRWEHIPNCSITEIAATLDGDALQCRLVEWAACAHLS
jgi:broad specificity phosphatase PhoE